MSDKECILGKEVYGKCQGRHRNPHSLFVCALLVAMMKESVPPVGGSANGEYMLESSCEYHHSLYQAKGEALYSNPITAAHHLVYC